MVRKPASEHQGIRTIIHTLYRKVKNMRMSEKGLTTQDMVVIKRKGAQQNIMRAQYYGNVFI